MDTLPICQAKSKQTGRRCKNFAVKNRAVCHIHGGKTPRYDARHKTEAGKIRQKMGSWKHGLRSKEAIEERKTIRNMIMQSKNFLNEI